MPFEPLIGRGFLDNGQNLDGFLSNIIEHPYVSHAESILWTGKTSQFLDSALGNLTRFVPEV